MARVGQSMFVKVRRCSTGSPPSPWRPAPSRRPNHRQDHPRRRRRRGRDPSWQGAPARLISKTTIDLAMVLDFAGAPLCGRDNRGAAVNAARDRVVVRLPVEEPEDMRPPTADHVEAVGWLLAIPYMVGLLVLDAVGCRVGELVGGPHR